MISSSSSPIRDAFRPSATDRLSSTPNGRARAYGVYFISEQDPLFLRLRSRFKLEHGLVLTLLIALTGMVLFGYVMGTWAADGFGELHETEAAIVGATLIAIAAQVFFTSFLLSILGLRYRTEEP